MMMRSFDEMAVLRRIVAREPRDVVIVVGAGVTIGALRGSQLGELASWQGLLSAGLDRVARLRLRGAEDVARIRGLLGSQDPAMWIDAAEMITRALGGPEAGEMRAWLRDSAGSFAGDIRDREVLEALSELHKRGAMLATVNYDGTLEAVTGARAVTWREPALVERVIRGEERGILHLHGYWEDPRSIVLGSRSYGQVVDDAHAQTVLRVLRLAKTLVFVGHGAGLQDPNWGSFLRWTGDVFAGSEYRHYRLVREDERDRMQAEHPVEQRIVALPYGATHADLGPFLRSLVPAESGASAAQASAPASEVEPRARTVILLLNIGQKGDHWLSEAEIRGQVRDADAECFKVEAVLERHAITARQWRELTRKIEQMLAAARAVPGPVKIVVAGQAWLPLFVYLGYCMRRDPKPTFYNKFNGDWDVIPPPDMGAPSERDLFEVTYPHLGRVREGRAVLSLQCSKPYPYSEEMVEGMIMDEGRTLLGSYTIHSKYSKDEKPLKPGDLPVVLRHVDAVLEAVGENADGLVLALGGPSWVAYWVGRHLNGDVCGRVDVPNLVTVPKKHYARALSLPMHRAPWLSGRVKLLVMAAEPDDQGRTGSGRLADGIRREIELELGRNGPYEIRVVGAVRVDALMRELDLFMPDILHLHLHGAEDQTGALAFEDERGDTRRVEGSTFVKMFESSRARPTLIVLSACHSQVLSPKLLEIAECVIAMDGAVSYKAAIVFARYFYGALGRGHALAEAIEQGRAGAESERASGYDAIVPQSAPGVDAGEIVLFPQK